MELTKLKEGTTLTIALEGRLDTVTAEDLDKELKESLDGIKELIFDFEKLDYITSAGLRVITNALKVMNRQGRMVIRNMQPDVKEVFFVTGFLEIIDVE